MQSTAIWFYLDLNNLFIFLAVIHINTETKNKSEQNVKTNVYIFKKSVRDSFIASFIQRRRWCLL